MKKLLVICVMPALFLVGCGDSPPPNPDRVTTTDETSEELPEIHNDDGDAKWVWTEHPDTGERVWCIAYKDGYAGGFDCLIPETTEPR